MKTFREVLDEIDWERHRPALEYLAQSEKCERHRNEIERTCLEITELTRVIGGNYSAKTKAYCLDELIRVVGVLSDLMAQSE